MIIPMKKLSLLIFYQDYQSFLEKLRDIGVVHVHENKERAAKDELLHSKLLVIKQLNGMIQRLHYIQPQAQTGYPDKLDNVDKLNNLDNLNSLDNLDNIPDEQLEAHLQEKFQRQEQVTQQLSLVQKDISIFEPWGDFSRDLLTSLETAGCIVRFFSVPEQKFKSEWEEQVEIIPISEHNGHRYFVTVTDVEARQNTQTTSLPEIEAEQFYFPKRTKEELLELKRQLQQEHEEITRYLDNVAAVGIARLEHYREAVSEITDELNVKDAAATFVEEKIIALEGWFPITREADLKGLLASEDVYYEISNSKKEEDVPVLLKNGKFSKLFEPIGDMYDLPNYRELDLTAFFAPFFMLFFGLCMGDGGYGLLILLICVLFKRKVPAAMQGYLKLGQFLGGATILVGILTGSFFGISLDAVTWPWLQGVKQYFITQANYGHYFSNYNPMMFVAFAFGAVQILFAMCLNVAKISKQHGFKYALSETGWVVLLVTLMLTYGLPYFGIPLSPVWTYIGYGLMSISAAAICFFNSPDKNIFVNIGMALWGTYNMATGLLGDILSYVRLFALGLTGSILGSVFNMIAIDMTASLPFVPRFVLMLLILLVGHTLNLAIAMIGAFVHPMRLTFVEFYKNAGFEGLGKRYAPFRKRTV
ncbi:V-type ATP synthase subunit I [Bacteroidia bacterium]|nr:V-type ATP synthase subunit I [Bacteroidia bacterium]